MKKFVLHALVLSLVIIVGSCKKQYPSGGYPVTDRKIRFQLYTNQDFSGNASVINFSVFIKTANTNLFDSAFSSMQLKDIPDAAHKLVIEKTVRVYNNVDLAAGFRYDIHDVGSSTFIDTSRAGTSTKVIDFAFQ